MFHHFYKKLEYSSMLIFGLHLLLSLSRVSVILYTETCTVGFHTPGCGIDSGWVSSGQSQDIAPIPRTLPSTGARRRGFGRQRTYVHSSYESGESGDGWYLQ
jgi:hypothetical protein